MVFCISEDKSKIADLADKKAITVVKVNIFYSYRSKIVISRN